MAGVPEPSSWLEGLDWVGLGKEVGLGAFLGFTVGFAAKKAMKLVLVGIALVVLLIVALESRGFVTIHWDSLEAFFSSSFHPDQAAGALGTAAQDLSRFIPGSSSFLLGCFLGFRKG